MWSDGSEDDDIACFKPDKQFSKGCEMLKSQMNFLRQDEENPFTPDAEDVDVACPDHLLISDDDDHDNEEIEID